MPQYGDIIFVTSAAVCKHSEFQVVVDLQKLSWWPMKTSII